MAKRTKTVKIIGRCRICGCTDGNGCEIGCAWASPAHDLCSLCNNVAWRIAKKGGKQPSSVPVFGLWCEHGGPDGRGYWLTEVATDGATQFPALFFSRNEAMEACRRENSPNVEGSLANSGWSCVIVELCEKRVIHP